MGGWNPIEGSMGPVTSLLYPDAGAYQQPHSMFVSTEKSMPAVALVGKNSSAQRTSSIEPERRIVPPNPIAGGTSTPRAIAMHGTLLRIRMSQITNDASTFSSTSGMAPAKSVWLAIQVASSGIPIGPRTDAPHASTCL
jgi:hypothetical protein